MRSLFVFTCLLLFASNLFAQGSHEYAPLQQQTINYKDWSLKSVAGDQKINLRDWSKDKKLVLVVYFASWCPNWHNEASVVARLYNKYKDQGFGVVAVSEYGSVDDARAFFGKLGAPYPVVVESESRDAREKTDHFLYRKATGDKRNWGSPYNVFLEPAKFTTDDKLIEQTWIVNGELIEDSAEDFIREKLGLAKIERKTATNSAASNTDKNCPAVATAKP
ncbi:MAG: TlpA disulfide reductase family protein [Pyrinomonadaceae bacterium]